MSEELRAALDRFRRCQTAFQLKDVYGCSESREALALYAKDEAWLAQEYLAEHPADYAEPVTEEWLVARGFEWSTDEEAYIFADIESGSTLLVWRCCTKPVVWALEYDNDFTWPHDIHQRGHLLQVCKALGITLKEP